MPFGAQILGADGTLWMSPDVTPLNMVQRLDVTITTGIVQQTINTIVPSGNAFMCFARVTSQDSIGMACQFDTSGGVWRILVKASRNATGSSQTFVARFYVFSNYVPGTMTHGIAYYNSAGTLVWRGDMRPLELNVGTIPATSNTINIGATCAVVPQYVRYSLELYSPGTPPVYLYFEWGTKAYGTSVTVWPVNGFETTSATGDPTWDVRTFFYIKTAVYDL